MKKSTKDSKINSKTNTKTKQARILAETTFYLKKVCSEKEAFFAEQFNLTAVEFRCLNYLKDKEYIIIKDLADNMNLTPSRLTRLITSLEKKKFIIRHLDEFDRRNVRVYINKKAKEKVIKIDKLHIELHKTILDMVPESERQEAMNLLLKLQTVFGEWADAHLKGRVKKNIKD